MQYDTSKQKTMTRNNFEITLSKNKTDGVHKWYACVSTNYNVPIRWIQARRKLSQIQNKNTPKKKTEKQIIIEEKTNGAPTTNT